MNVPRGAAIASQLLAVLLSACTLPAAPERTAPLPGDDGQRDGPDKRIVAAIKGEPPALNYTLNRGGAGGVPGTTELDILLNAGLVIRDDLEGRLVPQLAEAVPTIDNGLWRVHSDGRMETTWRIREGARWHDGTPFTADDLVFTTEVSTDEELPLVRYPAYEALERVEADDSRTVTVHWARPYIQADELFTTMAAWPIPKHILERTYREDKSKLATLPYWTSEYVGTGAFKLGGWVDGSHANLQAFDGFILGRPRIDRLEVRFIPDGNTLIANLLAGEIEMYFGRGISLEQAIEAENQWPDGKLDAALTSWYGLYPQFLNPIPPAVAELAFREGLVYAMDRQEIVETFMGGLTSVADVVVSPADREFREIQSAIVRRDYEPRRSAQLIESLGYVRAADGGFRDASGQRLAVELRTGAGDELQEKMVLSIADYWERAGVAAEPLIFPRQRSSDREFRQTRPAFEMVRQPPELNRFHGSGTPLPENDFTGHNRTRYRNAELDGLLDRYYMTIPWNERMGVLRQLVQHLTGQLVAMGVLYDAQPILFANRLVGISAAQQTANAHEWDIR
ncbi:MAG: hypothetical protein GEU73_06225 [Chloroflexi bacterium]|nr:hypothetical protein [Chloroflexota bacterium]